MKKTLLLVLIVFVSISHIKADDTAYSDEIQDTFFGVKFGTSKEDAKAAFLDRGFKIVYEELDYIYIENIRFGGYPWSYMLVEFRNNRFAFITFGKKSMAIEQEYSIFRDILSDLSKKYNMTKKRKEGKTLYLASSKQKTVCLNFDFKERTIFLRYFDVIFYTDETDQF